jgi:hypothetical protein
VEGSGTGYMQRKCDAMTHVRRSCPAAIHSESLELSLTRILPEISFVMDAPGYDPYDLFRAPAG